MARKFSAALLAGIPLAFAPMAMAQTAPVTPSDGADQTLEEVVVSGKFVGLTAASAMKMDIPVRDTPFTVGDYTGSFMKAIETTNVADLYQYMTGIQAGGGTGTDITFRGFQTAQTDINSILIDGLPGLAGRFNSPPTIGTDHLELVKGPASVLYGQAQPGGFINMLTKKPKATQQGEIDVRGILGQGRTKGYDLSGDITGPVPHTDAKLLYSMIADYENEDTFRTDTYRRPLYLAPSLTWNISDSTLATLQFEYRETRNAADTFLVAPRNNIKLVAPLTTHYQEPGDYISEAGRSTTLSVQHSFDNGIVWNFGFRDTHQNDETMADDVRALRSNLQYVGRIAHYQQNAREYDFADTSLTIPFDILSIGNRLLVGANGGRYTLNTNRLQYFNAPQRPNPQSLDISIYNPVYGIVPSRSVLPAVNPNTPQNLDDRYTKTFTKGLYLSDLVTLTEQWKLLAGVRLTSDEQQNVDQKGRITPLLDRTMNAVLPMTGLVFEPSPAWSFYASYSTSYVPPLATAIDIRGNNNFGPTTAQQEEAGVKADLFDSKLTATLAWFHIDEQNILSPFSCNFGICYVQNGGALSQGEEFELNAHPMRELQVVVGYSHLNPIITDSVDPAQIHARLVNAARNSAHLWTRYDFHSGSLDGFGAGLGITYTGDRAGNLPTTADRSVLRLPAYVTTDLAFYYLAGPYDFTLRVANLFDRGYFQSVTSENQLGVVPGEPRTAILSVRAHF